MSSMPISGTRSWGFDADEIVIALNPGEEALFAERVATADLRPSVDGSLVRTIVVRIFDMVS